MTTGLLEQLISRSAERTPERCALVDGQRRIDYQTLAQNVTQFSHGVLGLQGQRGDRVAIWLEKRAEFVVAAFGAAQAGLVFVPVNPVLKAEQVGHILADCSVRYLVTSVARWRLMAALADLPIMLPALQHVILVDGDAETARNLQTEASGVITFHRWVEVLAAAAKPAWRHLDQDLLAVLYTSGSTGKPKGVVLSHRNMVVGAHSVASYLGNHAEDCLLAALPLSFDAGFSQLTTAFSVGAQAVLLNYLLPRDVLNTVVRERVTGLTAVPPLWIQLASLAWPTSVHEHFRYFANTGGKMPLETLTQLRTAFGPAKPYLMYGLTEAFRSTYLPPEEVDRRPNSIGQAIPNAEILVLRPDGTLCDPGEPGELVHRGPLVGQGYWNDAEKTAERYRLLPAGVGGRHSAMQLPEYAVFSGDYVQRDADGFLYFIGRKDEMIKSSGYRMSPVEIEEILYNSGAVAECAAFGVEHTQLGQVVVVAVHLRQPDSLTEAQVLETVQQYCRAHMPAYMVPSAFWTHAAPLPRNANGKIDRKALSTAWPSQSSSVNSHER